MESIMGIMGSLPSRHDSCVGVFQEKEMKSEFQAEVTVWHYMDGSLATGCSKQ